MVANIEFHNIMLLRTTHFMDLNNVQQEGKHMPFIFKMDSPSDEGSMIGKCPGICGKV